MAENSAVTWSFCLMSAIFHRYFKKKSRDFLVPTVWTAIFCVQIPPVIPFSFVCLYTYLCEDRATFIPHLISPQGVGGVQWKPVEFLAESSELRKDPFTGNNEFVNLSVIKIRGLSLGLHYLSLSDNQNPLMAGRWMQFKGHGASSAAFCSRTNRTFCDDRNILSVSTQPSTAATSHPWLLSTWNGVEWLKNWIFKFSSF